MNDRLLGITDEGMGEGINQHRELINPGGGGYVVEGLRTEIDQLKNHLRWQKNNPVDGEDEVFRIEKNISELESRI